MGKECKIKARARVKRYRETHTDKVLSYANWYRKTDTGKYNTLRQLCKIRKIELNITKEEFCNFNRSQCFYCEEAITDNYGYSLDRKDNNKGYVLDNVVACCSRCNTIKHHILTFEEMLVVSKALRDFRNRKADNEV